jgi:hypothetical protein
MKKLTLSITLLICLVIVSCKKNEIASTKFSTENKSISNVGKAQLNDISLNEIKNVGLNFINRGSTNGVNAKASKLSHNLDKSIKNVTQHKSNDGLSSIYIINYQPQGFTILSDNQNANPILAFSETGEFDLTKVSSSIGINNWLKQSLSYVHQSKNMVDSISRINSLRWYNLLNENSAPKAEQFVRTSYSTLADDPQRLAAMNQRMGQLILASGHQSTVIPLSYASSYLPADRLSHFKSIASQHGSPEQYTIVEILNRNSTNLRAPMMGTNWYQDGIFGAFVPNHLAGCTAVAAGQIMNFYKFPATINWNDMSNSNIYNNDEISRFMQFLGQSFQMDYSPTGSGATTGNVKLALQSFGYQVTVKDHSFTDVMTSINQGKPVFLVGCQVNGGCHAWVAEGSRQENEAKAFRIEWQTGSYTYETDGIEYWQTGNIYNYFYINWGWGESVNGWFSNFTANTSTNTNYDQDRKNMYITKP